MMTAWSSAAHLGKKRRACNTGICKLIGGGPASSAAGQFAITAAYCYAPAREISVYDDSQVLFSAVLGFAVFGQIPAVTASRAIAAASSPPRHPCFCTIQAGCSKTGETAEACGCFTFWTFPDQYF